MSSSSWDTFFISNVAHMSIAFKNQGKDRPMMSDFCEDCEYSNPVSNFEIPIFV